MTIAHRETRRQPGSSLARGLVGYIPPGQPMHRCDNEASSNESEASLAVLVSGAARDNLFHSMFRSRWLADLKLIEAGLHLPLQQVQRQCLRDYRDLLLTALGWCEAEAATIGDRGAIRRFLVCIRDSHNQELANIFGHQRMGGFDIDERRKFANVWALFRSLPPARSLTEALGFTIVVTSAPG